MSSGDVNIPRHAGAGSSFFGAEFGDAWVLLLSLALGMVFGRINGLLYLAIPAGGYLLNREYLQWLASGPPGRLRMWLYELGLRGYPGGHASARVVVVGDARVINRGASDMLDQTMARLEQAQRQRVAGGEGVADFHRGEGNSGEMQIGLQQAMDQLEMKRGA